MTVPSTIDAVGRLNDYVMGGDGDTDLARAMLGAFAERLMSAQASMLCEAGYNERTEERMNSRNGYRHRAWDTRRPRRRRITRRAPPTGRAGEDRLPAT